MMNNKSTSKIILLPWQKAIIAVVVAICAYFLSSSYKPTARWMFTLNSFSIVYLFLSWWIFCTMKKDVLQKFARIEDGNRIFVFLMVLLSCFLSLLNTLMLVVEKNNSGISHELVLTGVVFGILLSWSLVHTLFTYHYARMYYKNEPGGLEFPTSKNGNEEYQPDYLDFAYFSFTIGATFQVSDVGISDPAIRKIVLVHGVLSFLINTFVVALTINFIAGLVS